MLQSIAEGFTVGATAKLVRGSLASGLASVESWDDGYELADRLEDEGRTTADVDVGLTAGSGRVRLGLVARNLAAPTFEADGDSWQLQRHVRAGAAWGDRWPGTPRLIVAVDADLTTVEGVGGERRDLAVGGERWFRNGAVAIRGGLRASTLGRSRPLASAGASYAVRSGIYIDAMAAAGRDGDRRWGIAGRLSY